MQVPFSRRAKKYFVGQVFMKQFAFFAVAYWAGAEVLQFGLRPFFAVNRLWQLRIRRLVACNDAVFISRVQGLLSESRMQLILPEITDQCRQRVVCELG